MRLSPQFAGECIEDAEGERSQAHCKPRERARFLLHGCKAGAQETGKVLLLARLGLEPDPQTAFDHVPPPISGMPEGAAAMLLNVASSTRHRVRCGAVLH